MESYEIVNETSQKSYKIYAPKVYINIFAVNGSLACIHHGKDYKNTANRKKNQIFFVVMTTLLCFLYKDFGAQSDCNLKQQTYRLI